MFTRDELIKGLTDLDAYLSEQDLFGEIAIYGGACLSLVHSARVSTKDVDAVFQPTALMRKAIFEVSLINGWEWNWVNDDVAGFLSDRHTAEEVIPELESLSHLKVTFPTPDYLLAMKCLAARAGADDDPSPDLADAIWLCGKLSLHTENDIQQVIQRYYPESDQSPKIEFFVHEVAQALLK